MPSPLSIGLRVLALTIVLFVCFAVAGPVLGPPAGPPAPDQAAAAAAAAAGATALLAVCLLNTAVMSYIMLRSRWAGWRLVATVFVVYYGVTTVMGQIESAVFITRLPPGMLPRLFLMGALIAAPFAALGVLILGKSRAEPRDAAPNQRLRLRSGEWAWTLAAIAVAYVMLYFTFGYFVAWRNPAVREYYGGTDEGGFLVQMRAVLRDTPWLVLLQLGRALLWTAIALPVIRMMKGTWQETALALGLLFAVVMNSQLLLPNPYMPESVRLSHLVETASANFIFGWLVGALLARPAALRSA